METVRWTPLLALAAAGVVVAHASGLGGFATSTMFAVDRAGSAGVPVVLTCDDFSGTSGATMSGRVVTVASSCANAVWTTHAGTWSVQSNRAAPPSVSAATATLNVGAIDCTVQIGLTSLNVAGRVAGVVVSHDGSSTFLAAVLVKGPPDVAELRLYLSGATTVLASAPTSILSSDTLVLNRSGSKVTMTLNGSVISTVTLNANQLAALGTARRPGLFGGNNNVRFDDLLVTTP